MAASTATSIPLDDHWMRGVEVVEESLGYRFRDRRLLLTALTHRSFCNENNTASGDFDELEWLGDSVLQLAVSSWLFRTARGSQRTSGHLSKTRVRFVDAGACESFAQRLNLIPFLRIGQGQPVRGTKILADCFEAVLGAVYVDAGGCSGLEPVHEILARVIPSYDLGRRSDHQPPPHHHHPHALEHALPPHGMIVQYPRPPASPHLAAAEHLAAPAPRAGRGEEPRKLMNLAHRLMQMAKQHVSDGEDTGARGVDSADASVRQPNGLQPDRLEVLRDFDTRLRVFQQNPLRAGALSYSTSAFAEAFNDDVARFYGAMARNPDKSGALDSVLAGEGMLRKEFAEAPMGAERVVMEVVLIPAELRRQFYTVVEFLLTNVLRGANVQPHQKVLRLIESAPNGAETVRLLETVVGESASSLLFTSHQRSVISEELTNDSTPSSSDHATRGNFSGALPGYSRREYPGASPPPGTSGGEEMYLGFWPERGGRSGQTLPLRPPHLGMPMRGYRGGRGRGMGWRGRGMGWRGR